MKILVVDDDENLRRLVAAYLESEGYEVEEAADGPSAIAAVEREEPQLVVLDLMLPGLSGLEVARQIRTDTDYPHLDAHRPRKRRRHAPRFRSRGR